jgi:hypothetical protein
MYIWLSVRDDDRSVKPGSKHAGRPRSQAYLEILRETFLHARLAIQTEELEGN